MEKVFLDTSFLVALEDNRDQNHQSALDYWNTAKSSVKPVTTSYICDETVTIFNKRNLHDKAVEIGERLIYSPNVDFIYIDESKQLANLFTLLNTFISLYKNEAHICYVNP